MCIISPISQCIWADFTGVFPCRCNTARLHVAHVAHVAPGGLATTAGPAISRFFRIRSRFTICAACHWLVSRFCWELGPTDGYRDNDDNGFKVGRDDLDGGYAWIFVLLSPFLQRYHRRLTDPNRFHQIWVGIRIGGDDLTEGILEPS